MKWGKRMGDYGMTVEQEKKWDSASNKREETYDKWRRASGSEKRQLKKELQGYNKELYQISRENGRSRKQANVSSKMVVISTGDKENGTGDGLIEAHDYYDPNRKSKQVAKRTGQFAASAAIAAIGYVATKKICGSNISPENKRILARGTAFTSGVLSGSVFGKATVGSIRDAKTNHKIKRWHKHIDEN